VSFRAILDQVLEKLDLKIWHENGTIIWREGQVTPNPPLEIDLYLGKGFTWVGTRL